MAEYRIIMKDDELYHWKYRDKYKKNGKWVYIYDEAKKTYNNAKVAVKKTRKKVGKKIDKIEKQAKKDYKKFKKDVGKTYDKVSKDVKVAYDNASKAVSKAYNTTSQAVSKAYNTASQAVTKAYNRAAPKIKSIVSKVISAVKNLVRKGKEFLFGTRNTKKTTEYRITPDATRVRFYASYNTTITDPGIVKLYRKGKKSLSKALGKNTNTYRTDRLEGSGRR